MRTIILAASVTLASIALAGPASADTVCPVGTVSNGSSCVPADALCPAGTVAQGSDCVPASPPVPGGSCPAGTIAAEGSCVPASLPAASSPSASDPGVMPIGSSTVTAHSGKRAKIRTVSMSAKSSIPAQGKRNVTLRVRDKAMRAHTKPLPDRTAVTRVRFYIDGKLAPANGVGTTCRVDYLTNRGIVIRLDGCAHGSSPLKVVIANVGARPHRVTVLLNFVV